MKPIPPIGFVLLGVLFQGPRHGYDMLRFMDQHLTDIWHVSNSQLYTLLKRLEKKGYITSQVQVQETRPSKKTFHLTNTGKNKFLEWLHRPVSHAREFRVEFVAKLFFFNEFGIKGGKELIETQIQYLEEKKELIHVRIDEQSSEFKRLIFDFKSQRIIHLVEWLSDAGRSFFNQSENK